MSRSYKKHPEFINYVAYFSNKKSRTRANRKLRHKNKQIIKNAGKRMELCPDLYDLDLCDDIPLKDLINQCDWMWEYSVSELCNADFYVLREVSDVWDFDSDGLKAYYGKPDWRDSGPFIRPKIETEEEYMKFVRSHEKLYNREPFNQSWHHDWEYKYYWAKYCYYRYKMK